MKDFSDLGLSKELVLAVTEKGYTTPSPIQEQAIPAVLKGRDILAAAQTGTGKTAGFTLPIIQQLSSKKLTNMFRGKSAHPRALVLTPTRELAAQILANVEQYASHTNLKSQVVFGGVKINPQISKLRSGVDILIATPGRLLDLCSQGACDLSKIETLVLDEADRMLDMGFIHDIRKVLKLLPKKRQTLLFSATFSKEIKALANDFIHNPITIEITPENTTAETVTQRAYRCDAGDKPNAVTKLIKQEGWKQVLIFTRTKHGANRLATKLEKDGIPASAIHGNKSQNARTKALEGFKEKSIRALVATDIAARGIDISQLPNVINYELPNVAEDYVHRIGRTGRAGASGLAVSLVCNDERPFLKAIEKLISQDIALEDIEGFEPQNWPDKAPSAAQVLKAAARKKEEARKARGPRKPRNGQSKGREKSKEGGAGKPAQKKASTKKSTNRRGGGGQRRRRSSES